MTKHKKETDTSSVTIRESGVAHKTWYSKTGTGVYYDQDSGRVGFGSKYGERSFNQRPVRSEPMSEKFDSIGPSRPPRPSKEKGS